VNGLDTLLAALSQLAPGGAVAPALAGLDVTRLEFDLPLEAQIAAGGELLTSLPRGLLATGFEPPRCRLRVRYEVTP